MTQRRLTCGSPGRRLIRVAGALAAFVTGACTPPGLPPPQSPLAATSGPTSATGSQTITVGIDGPVNGFNPYAIADFSPAARAVDALVLPSVSQVRADGHTGFDAVLVDSATVTSSDPFTVTYQLDRNAAWSDGTPVTAEDFRYLQQQMTAVVGTTGAAPYRSISQIRSLDAGKKVQVVFRTPVRDWPTMFSPLLPAHILKDAPGGFTTALANGIPVSAGPYRVESVDRGTGLISLVRNDKYWGKQPGPASVMLRIGTGSELVAALERGDVQALLFQPGSAAAERLAATVPADRLISVPVPATTQLVFDTRSGPTASPAVRAAIANGLDRAAIADSLTASRSSGMRAVTSMVRLPVQAGAPAGSLLQPGDGAAAASELRAAGYDTTGLYARKNSVPLRVLLGYPSGDPRLASTARVVQQQLGRVGIEIDLLVDSPGAIIDRLSSRQIDMALLTIPRGWSDGVSAASAFGCPPVDGPRTGNIGGYCSAETEPALAAALAGRGDLSAADRQLWADHPVIPLGQPIAVFAVSPSLARVAAADGPGWLWTGPLGNLPAWPAG